MSIVSLVKVDVIVEALRRCIGLVGGLRLPGAPIFIKPNICTEVDASGGANTSIQVVRAIIDEILREDEDAVIGVVESDSQGKSIEKAFETLGYFQLEDEYRSRGRDVSLINLSKAPTTIIPFKGLYFRELKIPKILLQRKHFISVAKPKTHGLTGITGVMKNQFGCLPEKNKAAYHGSIDRVIVDLNRVIQPDLCLVDGVVGMEGVVRGRLRRLGVFLCGRNPVSTDAVLAKVMGFKPSDIKHLVLAEKCGLGSIHPEVVGERVESVRIKFQRSGGVVGMMGRYIPTPLYPIARYVYRRTLRRA